MNTARLGFESHDGRTRIHALMWTPQGVTAGKKVRGIVQIMHGMSEHIDRYIPFAQFLTSKGFVVCAHDYVGHGKSVAQAEDLGHIPLQGGKDVLLEDVHEMRKLVAARYPSNVSYIVFGHSMGSFVTRAYVTRHGEGLAAAILCGTGQQPVLLSKAGNALCHLLASMKDERYKSGLLENMTTGGFAKAIEGARTGVDWISKDDAVVDAYVADPLCGQPFTVGGYAALTDLTGEVVTFQSAGRVPKALPMLFVAGTEDPVGDCGKGVHAAAEMYRSAGVATVDEKLFEGMRHEILNEQGKAEVCAFIDEWLMVQGI